MSTVAFVRRLLEAGFSIEDALRAAEAHEATVDETAPVRSKGAARQARYAERKRQKTSENVSDDASDVRTSEPPFPSSPPAPPQLPIPPSGSVTTREGCDDWPTGKASDHAKTLEALNLRIDPARKTGLVTSVGEIARWRQQGYSWALDVIPIVTAHAVRARADPVGTWTYFAQPIAQSHANRTRPAETVTPQASHERRYRPADKFERHQANLERAVAGAQLAARLRAVEPESSF